MTKLKLTGDRNQCPTCGKYFNSVHAFDKEVNQKIYDKHRKSIGWYVGIPKEEHMKLQVFPRVCLTEEQMRDIGMATNSSGFWVGTLMDDVTLKAATGVCNE